MIVRCSSVKQEGWLQMRQELWSRDSQSEHIEEMHSFLDAPERFAQFIAHDTNGKPVGFVEAALRHDYVNGTHSSPVAFLEGLYVAPANRRSGVGAALVAAVADWGRTMGCSELASDAVIDNETSHAMHIALGFEETERVVYFRKDL